MVNWVSKFPYSFNLQEETVFRSIYSFKTDNKQIIDATRRQNANTIGEFDEIKEISSEFDIFEPDL